MAEQWAEILAIAHARGNRPLPDQVYGKIKGDKNAFLELVQEVAFSYADRVCEDWEAFRNALRAKREEFANTTFIPPACRDVAPLIRGGAEGRQVKLDR